MATLSRTRMSAEMFRQKMRGEVGVMGKGWEVRVGGGGGEGKGEVLVRGRGGRGKGLCVMG